MSVLTGDLLLLLPIGEIDKHLDYMLSNDSYLEELGRILYKLRDQDKLIYLCEYIKSNGVPKEKIIIWLLNRRHGILKYNKLIEWIRQLENVDINEIYNLAISKCLGTEPIAVLVNLGFTPVPNDVLDIPLDVGTLELFLKNTTQFTAMNAYSNLDYLKLFRTHRHLGADNWESELLDLIADNGVPNSD